VSAEEIDQSILEFRFCSTTVTTQIIHTDLLKNRHLSRGMPPFVVCWYIYIHSLFRYCGLPEALSPMEVTHVRHSLSEIEIIRLCLSWGRGRVGHVGDKKCGRMVHNAIGLSSNCSASLIFLACKIRFSQPSVMLMVDLIVDYFKDLCLYG